MLYSVIKSRWLNEKYNCSVFKPPHDFRGYVKAVSVSYCASAYKIPKERSELLGNLAKEVASARSKRTHKL